ncbi:hypothetical protein B0H10DRAFT_1815010 [Mycena sp. CBHHK59/15]|nr:hypothetical protein B0H10DRAFT_1815010 [Mycena sp. CBHHK59/15]
MPKPLAPRALKISKPCLGLTAAFNAQVGIYLDRTVSMGGGAHAIGHYSDKLFKKEFNDLTNGQKRQVHTAQLHDRTWKNDTSPGVMASFAMGATVCLKAFNVDPESLELPVPCDSCLQLFTLRAYKNTINKPTPDQSNLRYVPHVYQNQHAGMLYAKFQGLEALMAEDNEYSLEHRFFQHVVNGDFKDDTVFNGIVQAKVLGKTREIKGLGKQNFKHNEDVDAVFGLIHAISPRAYRELSKNFNLRSERSIK